MIRKATIEDASRIAEILIFAKRMAYGHIFNDYKVSFGEMQVLPTALEYMENPDLLDGIFVFEEEAVKGLIRISLHDGDRCVEINELYIDPFFQNQQIGRQLLTFAETYAEKLGASKMMLWVLEKNGSARRFYEKNGFSFAGDQQLQEGTTEYKLNYCKHLSHITSA